jgi:hypothetical protein
MKRSPAEEELIRSLGPSKYSAKGFLGHDTRPIDEIISADQRKLDRLEISINRLVDGLKSIYRQAREAYGGEIQITPGVFATFYESRGRVPSPFKTDGVFEKGEAVVREKETGQHIIITELGIALIERHHFFQGLGSRYRIEPEVAVRLLGLTSFEESKPP